MYRFSVSTALLGAALLVAAGCNRTDRVSSTGEAHRDATARNASALVRYVNLMDAHANTDLYFGDLKVFSGSTGDQATGYKDVPSERRDFVLREAARPDGMEIEKNSEGLSAGKHYTVVAYENDKGNPELRVVNDEESAPATGKAKIRLIHAAAKMEPINVWVPGRTDKLAGESRFSTVSTWQEVDPVGSPLEIRAGDEKKGVRVNVPGGVEAGKLYTFVVGHGPANDLRVIRLVDSPMNTQ